MDGLPDEAAEAAFVQAFRAVIRLRTAMETYAEHDPENQPIGEQAFADYRSKYLDLHDRVRRERRTQAGKEEGTGSVLDDLDFEVALLHRDVINVAYILDLIAGLSDTGPEAAQARRKQIEDILNTEASLRNKRVPITRFLEFLDEEFGLIPPEEDPRPRFWAFWERERCAALAAIVETERLYADKVEALLSDHAFTGRKPLRDDLIGAMKDRPRLLEREARAERVWSCLSDHIDIFVEGLG